MVTSRLWVTWCGNLTIACPILVGGLDLLWSSDPPKGNPWTKDSMASAGNFNLNTKVLIFTGPALGAPLRVNTALARHWL